MFKLNCFDVILDGEYGGMSFFCEFIELFFYLWKWRLYVKYYVSWLLIDILEVFVVIEDCINYVNVLL